MCGEAGRLVLPVFTKPLPTEDTPSISNGLDPPVGAAAPGQQMFEKMRPSRQDPADGDAGEASALIAPLPPLALCL